MNTAFTVIVYTGIFLAIIVTCKIITLFLNINAKIENRRYMGAIKEWINLDPNKWFKGYYLDIFPISFFLYRLNKDRYFVFSGEVQQLYKKKFKYENFFWILFLFSLSLIPLSQVLVRQ